MKFLLTSAGIKNTSIHHALEELLGKPIAASSALCIPTAMHSMGGPAAVARLIRGVASTPLCELGSTIRPPYKSLTAPSTSSPRGTGSWLPTSRLVGPCAGQEPFVLPRGGTDRAAPTAAVSGRLSGSMIPSARQDFR